MRRITESKIKVKTKGGMSEYEKILFVDYTEWLLEILDLQNIQKNILLNYRKMPKHIFGNIDMKDLLDDKKKDVKINIDSKFGTMPILKIITHEMTHIWQIVNVKLGVNSDMTWFTWDGNDYITLEDYKSNRDFEKHKELPWEREAYDNSEIYPNMYKKTPRFTELGEKDPTLAYIISNNYL